VSAAGFIGDDFVGVNFFFPTPGATVADFFDRPTWERPSADLADIPGEFDFTDYVPGFTGWPDDEITGATPGFDGTLPESSYYSHDFGADGDGDGGTLTVITPGGDVQIVPVRASRVEFYRIEVYTQDGDLVSRIPGWTRGRLTRVLDRASLLSFEVPISEEGVSDLVRPNVIWLRDRWGFVVDTFQIQKRMPRGSGDASYVDIEAQGRITELAGEVVLSYAPEDRLTVAEHVAALFDLQERAVPTAIHEIDDEVGEIVTRFSCEDTNIHAALLQLQFTLPQAQRGRFYLDPKGRFNWRANPGDTTEQVISRDLNVKSITADIDYNGLINRIYLYGEGNDPATRLGLTGYIDEEDNEYTEDYLEDPASIATYGLHPLIKQDRRVKYQETLLRISNRILEEFAEPPTTVEVELLDVAKADNALPGWRDIEIGGRYRVTDQDLAIEAPVEIVRIETDLARPVPIRVELTNQRLTMADILSRIYDATQQPLDVDGDRYPSMGRNYSDTEPRDPRAGDTRWNDETDKFNAHDGDDWREIETDVPDPETIWYTAATKAELPNDESIAETALGRVIGSGSDNGMVCVRNPANDGWNAVNVFE
jgi:hypothetical protein